MNMEMVGGSSVPSIRIGQECKGNQEERHQVQFLILFLSCLLTLDRDGFYFSFTKGMNRTILSLRTLLTISLTICVRILFAVSDRSS